ncbi:single-stranded DNA-binding protein [Sporosarcina aquimarina]|uniref:Single-stranded DNA-binding protein n=1 Tax=Sporosarcina aquimarina TaxID=114975 RepID=A0ABU4G2D6_9BACL|nr:single-stranded DNA-binding protein [Sporosarcina aquimarina]MDW0111135.1 single-stranded DNA-binding protein [Sporosarcina aquimarina]
MNCLNIAILEVENICVGEAFLVKDLFKGYEWNRLAIGERRSLGSLFLNEVRFGVLKSKVSSGNKSSANQQLYIRI